MTNETKQEIISIVENTLKVPVTKIGDGLLRFNIKGNEIHQSYLQLEYYHKHGILQQYLTELQ